MSEIFYTFCFEGKNQGYYYLKQTKDNLLSETKFYQANGELYINTFQLTLEQAQVTAYKYRDREWVDFRAYPKNYFPTSAYPLLLSKALKKPYTYTAVSEHNDSVAGELVLTKRDNEILETKAGTVLRRFVMKDDLPVIIDWGGPISQLCNNSSEAVKDTDLKIMR